MNEKNAKITKQSHGYASTYNVEILISLKPELQLRDTEFPIRDKPISIEKYLNILLLFALLMFKILMIINALTGL